MISPTLKTKKLNNDHVRRVRKTDHATLFTFNLLFRNLIKGSIAIAMHNPTKKGENKSKAYLKNKKTRITIAAKYNIFIKKSPRCFTLLFIMLFSVSFLILLYTI
jgi:hypothetical protein